MDLNLSLPTPKFTLLPQDQSLVPTKPSNYEYIFESKFKKKKKKNRQKTI